jgi:hypothetical protein
MQALQQPPRGRPPDAPPQESEPPTSHTTDSSAAEPRHLLAPGSLGVLSHQLTVNGRGVCLYEHSGDSVRYFSPSLSGASVPIESGTNAWQNFVHVDDQPWLLDLHRNAVADGLGYEALFRFSAPTSGVVWVVDRQERVGAGDPITWRGISLDVTDLLVPVPPPSRRPSPIQLAVYCVSRGTSVRSRGRAGGSAPELDLAALPLSDQAAALLGSAIADDTTGTITVSHSTSRGDQRSTLLAWAPFDADPAAPLIAVAIADVSRHVAATETRRRRLHTLAQVGRGASFRLAPGGRARVRREWLRDLDPRLLSYSDLLDRAPGRQIRQLRAARRTALEALEGYCVTLTVTLGGRARQLVEAGLPDATGAIVECALIPFDDAANGELRAELTNLVQGLRLDPAAQLLRSLAHRQTVADAIALLVRVGAHESHVRRRLAIVQEVGDLGRLAQRYSHALAEPTAER